MKGEERIKEGRRKEGVIAFSSLGQNTRHSQFKEKEV